MRKKITLFVSLLILAAIVVSCIGQAVRWESPAMASAYINSTSSLTKVPANSKRDEMYLNDVWQFSPAVGDALQEPPEGGWGKIWVPGDWQKEGRELIPGIEGRGTGNAWENFDGERLTKAWYRYRVEIPENWEGRAIWVNFDRLSTDAKVYANGEECGSVDFPYGAVEVTPFVRGGEPLTLTVLVAAVADEKDTLTVMGPNEIYTSKGDKKLQSKGLIGEVRLVSFPAGARISDVFVQPSTRKKQIRLGVELTDVKQAGTAKVTATMFDEQGKIEREFKETVRIAAKATQNLQLSWNWKNPRLWDVGQPNLYTLRLRVEGEGIEDEYDQSFGFREFWIEGKKFYLNGTELRLRPTLYVDEWQGWGVGVPEVIDGQISGYARSGYNIAELWPWNYYERGRWNFRNIVADRADRLGFPLIAPALDTVRDGYWEDWQGKEGKRSWEPKMVQELTRDRNHPSILIWANSPNFFGHSDDQNPRRIGKKGFAGGLSKIENERMQKLIPIGEDIIATIKKYDPTRPVMMHQGAAVGDIYALNSYLNLIPLQEREEWLSNWSKEGEMPYMVVEFGTPLHASVMRGRNGFGQVIHSEPLMTEFSAIYLGKEAYDLETNAYRDKIREFFIKDREYKNWQLKPELDFAPAFQKVQQLFVPNTWRSWRTYGITGGMVPWSGAHGWEANGRGKERVSLPAFEPGRRGPYPEKVYRYFFEYLQPQSYNIYPAGKALLANNAPTLAWIAGSKQAFVAKDRNFLSGETLQKQAVLINDTRSRQNFTLNWQVRLKGNVLGTGEKTGTIATAQTLFFPLQAKLPQVNNKEEGEIILNAQIGNKTHQDRFTFRIFPRQNATQTVQLFDPVGKTDKMLQQLGYKVMPWQGTATDTLVIIGREALSGDYNLPGDLDAFVRNGGRVLIETQQREWLQKIGFRLAQHLTRRAFPVDSNHPALQGLDAEDLRDWRGESTLIEAYPNTIKNPTKLSPHGTPWYGWHWGNRGALSSATLEKPHLSGWRPILEAEFDLAYSPLMALDYGKGRVILNTLDLEDHLQDGAARQVAQQIISYGITAPLTPKVEKVVLMGSEEDTKMLDGLGVRYQKTNSFVADAALTILGSQVQVQDTALQDYLKNGGKVFFLPRRSSENPLGVKIKAVEKFGGSLEVPNWSELAGVSASDLRSRTHYSTQLIESGGEVGAGGLFSRIQVGDGVAIFCQINPEELNADTLTYFRYTRWRQTRAIAQILANLGATFQADSQLFNPQPNPKLYHPDYQKDFNLGDDPYRYYRW
ncbi:glycoside hydrolase family 2 TIM barrel-domain containing protein [Lusitaniella coriacea]|nr:glycoside hydrolase family 2 TIM barrel-domain containing protein [Lusitaniella coriacea]